MQGYAMKIGVFITWLLGIGGIAAFGQVAVESNKKSIKIGEQFELTLTASIEDNKIIVWPAIGDTLTKQLEIVSKSGLDTVSLSDGGSAYRQKLIVTSFDSGYYKIPALEFKYLASGDTIWQASSILDIHVAGISVDTSKAFRDISGPLDAPYTFRDALPYLIGITAAALIMLVGYFIVKRVKNRPKKEIPLPKLPIIPAHEKALAQLQDLKEKQLYQQGKVKRYYTELIDILKVYYMERYHIDTLEMTSAELAVIMNSLSIDNRVRETVIETLKRADLVKFAKANPLVQEHETSFEAITTFISVTAVPRPSKEEEA